MEIYQFKCFCSAYATRSFAKSAERAFISRQAFSKTMGNFEAELGAPLFERTPAGVEPTAFADALYPKAKQLLDYYEEVVEVCQKEASSARRLLNGAFALGSLLAIPMELFEDFRRTHPDVHLSMHIMDTVDCETSVLTGMDDFAVTVGSRHDEKLQSIELARDPLYVVGLRELFDFDTTHPTLEDLCTLRFLGVRKGFELDERLTAVFAEAGLNMEMDYSYPEYDLILEMMRKGKGVCMVPRHRLHEVVTDAIVAVRFPSENYYWQSDLVFLKDAEHSAQMHALIECLTEGVRRRTASGYLQA